MLDPKLQTKVAAPKRREQRRFYGLVAVAMAILLAALFAQSFFRGPAGDPIPTLAEQQARVAAYVQAGTLNLPTIAEAGRAEATASMDLDRQSAEVRESVENNETKLAWLTLWDDHDEDGDTVEIISQGYSRTVKLTNAPIRIAVPVPANGVINVRGVYDGGGGITVAIQTEQGTVAMPVMAVGQVIGVPVSAK